MKKSEDRNVMKISCIQIALHHNLYNIIQNNGIIIYFRDKI